jgi:hypothetical protein
MIIAMLRQLFQLCWTPLVFGQADEIRTLLKNSEVVWNRGDLAACWPWPNNSTTLARRAGEPAGFRAATLTAHIACGIILW